MNDVRRLLSEVNDEGAPPEFTPEERFLFDRFAVVAALLLDSGERYPELWRRHRDEGPSPELEADVRQAAENIATVMQTLRRRQDLVLAARETPINPAYATSALDQVFFSLTLLTSAEQGAEFETALTPEGLNELLELPKVKEWLWRMGADDV